VQDRQLDAHGAADVRQGTDPTFADCAEAYGKPKTIAAALCSLRNERPDRQGRIPGSSHEDFLRSETGWG
jgi:hypothetical protein